MAHFILLFMSVKGMMKSERKKHTHEKHTHTVHVYQSKTPGEMRGREKIQIVLINTNNT